MKKLLLLLLILTVCCSACQSAAVSKETSTEGKVSTEISSPVENITAPESSTAPASEETAATSSAMPSESVSGNTESDVVYPRDYNRNQVDLDKYGIKDFRNEDGSLNYGYVIDQISENQFDEPLKKNEIRLYMYDTGLYTVKSSMYSQAFSSIPPYKEEEEAGYRYNGSSIHFTLPEFGEDLGFLNLSGRNITDETDHAFVLKTIAQMQYVPYQADQDYKAEPSGNLSKRLAVSIDYEDGVQDHFIVGYDLYVYHFEGKFEDLWDIQVADVTEISTEPVPDEYFMRLYATALRYLHTERTDRRDVFGLSLFFSDLWSPSAALDDQELYIQCLMEKGSLFLEYEGKTHRIEKEEDIRKVISVCLRDIPLDKEYTENALWETDSEKKYREDGIRIYVMRDEEIKAEFYVGSDGLIRHEYEIRWPASGNWGMQTLRMYCKADFVATHLNAVEWDALIALMETN